MPRGTNEKGKLAAFHPLKKSVLPVGCRKDFVDTHLFCRTSSEIRAFPVGAEWACQRKLDKNLSQPYPGYEGAPGLYENPQSGVGRNLGQHESTETGKLQYPKVRRARLSS